MPGYRGRWRPARAGPVTLDGGGQLISLIAAIDRNRVVGAGNRIPWRLPADLRRFKALTLGHRVVMGRKTYESIGRPLPGRENVVVTRQRDYRAEGCRVVSSLEEALAAIPAGEEVFVIGGAELYAQSLPLADRIYLTHVDVAVEGGDAFFPVLDAAEWQPISEERHAPDAHHPYAYRYVTYERRPRDEAHSATGNGEAVWE